MTGVQRVNGALLLYHRPLRTDATTIDDHIEAFARYSSFPFWKLNTDLGFPPRLAGLRFDAVVLHYSLFASGPHPYLIDDRMLYWLDASADSYKVAFFQDEHQYCRKRFAFLDRHRIDCVYTCFAPEQHAETYGRYTQVPTVLSHVPAYVSEEMVGAASAMVKNDRERRIDIGYRARPAPPYFGRGGLEKVVIGDRFAELAAGSGLDLDISTLEEDRLYRSDWYRFLSGCRGVLGTESGVSCSDLEDEVREEYEELAARGENPTIERLEQGSLGKWDWAVPLRTTSARHFEAAAFRVCQVMFEGRYSGDLEPMVHYIPLRKDFSNFDEVLEGFRDEEVRRELTENAHRDLIASGAHSFESFVGGFDETLRSAGLVSPADRTQGEVVRRSLRGSSPRRVVMRYAAHWWAWLRRTHPGVWRTVHWATRPVVVPIRKLPAIRRR